MTTADVLKKYLEKGNSKVSLAYRLGSSVVSVERWLEGKEPKNIHFKKIIDEIRDELK